MLNQPWLTPVWNQAPWFQVDPTIVNKVPKEQEKSCTETVKPKSKGGRPRVKVKDKDLFDSFSYPFVEACKRLKIGSTALKRLCRERGIKRWPYRQHRALQKGQAKRAARLAAKGGSSTQACDTRLENKGTETNFEQATKKLVGNVSIQELQAALQNINTNEENGLLQVQRMYLNKLIGQVEKRVENEAFRSLSLALFNKIELPQDYFKSVLEMIMYIRNKSKAEQPRELDKELELFDTIVSFLQQVNAKVQVKLPRVASS